MARLTEEMVIARTRASDLSGVRKLNCWGTELSDISILRRMQNIEVLSLSVNCISSLSDLQYCYNLQELYIRKNKIRDLNQVCYLQLLPRLKNLWMDENPCSSSDLYRLTVLRALPQLEKLDNIVVQPEEKQDAKIKGKALVHPDDTELQDSSPDRSPSRTAQEYITSPAEDNCEYEEEYSDGSCPQNECQRLPNAPSASPHSRNYKDSREIESDYVQHRNVKQEEQDYYEADRRNSNVEPEETRVQQKTNNRNCIGMYLEDNNENECNDCNYQQDGNSSDESTDWYRRCSRSREEERIPHHYEQMYRQKEPNQKVISHQRTANQRPAYPKRPITRNSNILSAVLCLVKELDYPSLEVVEVAVKCRMDEIEG